MAGRGGEVDCCCCRVGGCSRETSLPVFLVDKDLVLKLVDNGLVLNDLDCEYLLAWFKRQRSHLEAPL